MPGERRAKDVKEYGCGYVIGNVAGYDVWTACDCGEIDLEHILLDDRDVGRGRITLAQSGRECPVDFDRGERIGIRREKICERPPSRPDFDDSVACFRGDGASYGVEHALVVQKMLPVFLEDRRVRAHLVAPLGAKDEQSQVVRTFRLATV